MYIINTWNQTFPSIIDKRIKLMHPLEKRFNNLSWNFMISLSRIRDYNYVGCCLVAARGWEHKSYFHTILNANWCSITDFIRAEKVRQHICPLILYTLFLYLAKSHNSFGLNIIFLTAKISNIRRHAFATAHWHIYCLNWMNQKIYYILLRWKCSWIQYKMWAKKTNMGWEN